MGCFSAIFSQPLLLLLHVAFFLGCRASLSNGQRTFRQVLSIEPQEKLSPKLHDSNCFPFSSHMYGPGVADSGMKIKFGPYMGFVYRDVSPFTVRRGDRLAFDMTAANDRNITLDIAMASTTSNGALDNDGPFAEVVRSGQANHRGDEIWGNFDLQFEVTADEFSFAGGGLILRFRARGDFVNDDTCFKSGVSGWSMLVKNLVLWVFEEIHVMEERIDKGKIERKIWVQGISSQSSNHKTLLEFFFSFCCCCMRMWIVIIMS